MIDFHLVLVRPETLRDGHVLPKIPRQILIICRHKPKTKGEVGEMGRKGRRRRRGIQRINRPSKKYFFLFLSYRFFYNRFFVLFYYYIFYYINFYHRFIIEILLYFLLYRFY